jgi:hypothetical protein
MVLTGTVIDSLDAHSELITALATVLLALVTVVYVRATFQLVSAQRLQAETPEVMGSFTNAHHEGISAQNTGKSTASELALLRGPGEGVAARIDELGVRKSLLPGEEILWKVRPPTKAGFEPGDLPLTIVYFDNNLATLYFKVMVLRFEGEAPTLRARNLGFVPGYCSAKDLRQRARRQMSTPLQGARYHWRTRKKGPTQLILDEETRAPLRAFLAQQVELLRESDPKLESTRTRI